MISLEKIAEHKILAALKAGDFDNLKGKGKPLSLEDNPFEPEDQRLANKILKDAGFSPPWMELWQEIESEIINLRYQSFSVYESIYPEKTKFKHTLGERIKSINRKIMDYNLSVPLTAFQRPILDLENEIKVFENTEDIFKDGRMDN